MKPATQVYLVYCKNVHGHVVLLGPAVDTQKEADTLVAQRKAEGWNATWVGLNRQSTWIVT